MIFRKKYFFFFFSVVFVFFFLGCDFFYNTHLSKTNMEDLANKKSLWTFIIYMAADNELENAAISDINELEAACAISENLQILVLVDKKGDGELDKKSGATLYQIGNDKNDSLEIISKKIHCSTLNLDENDSSTELNMASSETLRTFLDFIYEKYPSKEYGLIMWGHGTGYRSGSLDLQKNSESAFVDFKGLAVDDTSSDFMSTVDFGESLKNHYFSVIGFDTCFGMLLETAYEIKECGKYFIGSPGLVPSKGWDYYSLFKDFSTKEKEFMVQNQDLEENLNGELFVELAEKQFKEQYYPSEDFVISSVDLSKIEEIATVFDNFSVALANYIIDEETQQKVLSLFLNSVKNYKSNSFPSDVFLNVVDLGKVFSSIVPKEAEDLINILKKGENQIDLGIYFVTKLSETTNKEQYDNSYQKRTEKEDAGKLKFLQDNNGWVPNSILRNSLLDKLFYTNY